MLAWLQGVARNRLSEAAAAISRLLTWVMFIWLFSRTAGVSIMEGLGWDGKDDQW